MVFIINQFRRVILKKVNLFGSVKFKKNRHCIFKLFLKINEKYDNENYNRNKIIVDNKKKMNQI